MGAGLGVTHTVRMLFEKRPWFLLTIAPQADDRGDTLVAMRGGEDGCTVQLHRDLLGEIPANMLLRALAGVCDMLAGVNGELDSPPPHAALRLVHARRMPRLAGDGVLCVFGVKGDRVAVSVRRDTATPELLMVNGLCGLFLTVLAQANGVTVEEDTD